MNILYFGKGVRGAKCLQTLLAKREKICGVVTSPGDKGSLIDQARSAGVPVFEPLKVNDEEFIRAIEKISPDLFVLSGYTKILKKRILEVPARGSINLHGGKLPEYRGAAPINWQIINGEATGGCSIITVDEGIDTGPILAQERYPIAAKDDAASVLEKTLEIFPRLLVRVIDEIKTGTTRPVAQNPNEGKYYGRRKPEDGKIDWAQMTAAQAHNLVRALVLPYPGAFSFLNAPVQKKITIWKTSLAPSAQRGAAGAVLTAGSNGVLVAAADGALMIERVSVGDDAEHLSPSGILNAGDVLR